MGKHEEYPMVGRKCINREEQFLRWINITVCLKKKGKGVGMVMCTKKNNSVHRSKLLFLLYTLFLVYEM